MTTMKIEPQRGIRKFNPKYPQPLVKRERPPMPPLGAQVAAAESQMIMAGLAVDKIGPLYVRLKRALTALFGDQKTHCDHNPALILRLYNPKIKDVAARYNPHAHNPAFLLHRTTHGHHIKTNVSGDGAQRSDTSERMHRRRMDENRGLRPRKPKKKIPARVIRQIAGKPVDAILATLGKPRKFKWPTGRKIRSRGFK